MPIYEYRCRACGHEMEKLQGMNDTELTDCPLCGEAELHRLVSAPGFRLKGGGWYETDFKQGNKRNLVDSGESNEDATPSKVDSSGSESVEKKPAAKPDKSGGKNATAA